MQTEIGALYGGHRHTRLCREGWIRKKQHEAAEAARVALRKTFTAYGEDLKRVEVFKYLRRLLAYGDNNSQAMWSNLKKARKSWAQVGADPYCQYHGIALIREEEEEGDRDER